MLVVIGGAGCGDEIEVEMEVEMEVGKRWVGGGGLVDGGWAVRGVGVRGEIRGFE
jgi:hypothetical protein